MKYQAAEELDYRKMTIVSYVLGIVFQLALITSVVIGLTGCGDVTVNAEQPSEEKKKSKTKTAQTEDKEDLAKESEKESEEKTDETKEQEYILVSGIDGYAYSQSRKTWYWLSQEASMWHECPEGFGSVSINTSKGPNHVNSSFTTLIALYPQQMANQNTIFGIYPDGGGVDTLLYRTDATGQIQSLYENEVSAAALSICQKQ